jgi:hypothetical protein
MTAAARFFRWHRWLGWLVALQVLAWVAGGALFAWLPFKDWVKAESLVARPALELPPGWAAALAATLAQAPAAAGPVLDLRAVATASGPALRLRTAEGEQWWSAAGGQLRAPEAADIERFARALYRGAPVALRVERLQGEAARPLRLGIVREAPPRPELWRAQFDDALGTRLYLDAHSGELLAVRTEAWVWYDFFWRLHVMDWSEGEDFNHPLVRAASLAALALALTGAALSVLALRRRWRRRPGAVAA